MLSMKGSNVLNRVQIKLFTRKGEIFFDATRYLENQV